MYVTDDDYAVDIAGTRYIVTDWDPQGKTGLFVETASGAEWFIFDDVSNAQEHVKDYWYNMAQAEPRMFSLFVSVETLVGWALGDGSLEEWLTETSRYPEQRLATDGDAHDAFLSESFSEEISEITSGLCFVGKVVAYRAN